jgi:hypothetical protein
VAAPGPPAVAGTVVPGVSSSDASEVIVVVAACWSKFYNFKNIFAEKYGEKIGVFCSNYS